MSFQQFISILLARKILITRIFLSIVLLTLIGSLVFPNQYEASTTVVVDVKSPDPIAGMVLPGVMTPAYMSTQIDIINSERVAQRVASMLKLADSPKIVEDWKDDTDGKGDINAWLADLLSKKLTVKPSRDSNVIEIVFKAPDPEFAAVIANAFAQSYIDTNIDLRVDPARQYATWFDSQIKQQRERLERAQKALSDYQQSNGIVATDERLDAEMQKLSELSSQLTLAQSQGADAASKRKMGNKDTLPEIMQNPLINQMKADIAHMESKLKEMSGNLGENHPQYMRAEAELAEAKARLNAETGKILRSVVTSGQVSEAKEKELTVAIDEQKKRILDMRKRRDEANVLLREVDAAQRAFDALGQRMTQSQLEAQSMQTNASILTPATPPFKPSSPNLPLNMAVAVFLGGVISVGVAFLLELLRRRIRSAEDLIQLLPLPVLAEIGSSRPELRRRRLGWLKDVFRVKRHEPLALRG